VGREGGKRQDQAPNPGMNMWTKLEGGKKGGAISRDSGSGKGTIMASDLEDRSFGVRKGDDQKTHAKGRKLGGSNGGENRKTVGTISHQKRRKEKKGSRTGWVSTKVTCLKRRNAQQGVGHRKKNQVQEASKDDQTMSQESEN